MTPGALDQKILLASASPRRLELLEACGFTVSVAPSHLDETIADHLPAAEVPVFLAQAKARAVLPRAKPGEIIVAADSVVILRQRVLGKPADRADALEMLKKLSGKTHRVITGVCMISGDRQSVFASQTLVTLHQLSPSEITYYIDHCQPYDKAGSYGIQEWLGWCRIRDIHGSYSNVMGLPVDLVYEQIERWCEQAVGSS